MKPLLPILFIVVLAAYPPVAAVGDWRPIIIAQSDSAAVRINALEHQIRILTGQIETFNFQLLQLQENFKRMQNDNEFRFQELEGRNSADIEASKTKSAKNENNWPNNDHKVITKIDDNQTDSAGNDPNQNFGTLTFDTQGNIVGGALGKPLDLTVIPKADDIGRLAKNPLANTPESLYRQSYAHFQAGDYQLAERGFKKFRQNYPDNSRISDASYWLGESLFSRGRFQEAASIFLDAHKAYPNAKKGPEILLKLGLSLAGLNQREISCATYAKVESAYPSASSALKRRLAAEQRAANCH